MDMLWAAEAVEKGVEVAKVTAIDGEVIKRSVAFFGAALCMGMGAIGAGLGIGLMGGRACESIARQPEAQGGITRTVLLAGAFAEATAIYAFAVALILLFVAK